MINSLKEEINKNINELLSLVILFKLKEQRLLQLTDLVLIQILHMYNQCNYMIAAHLLQGAQQPLRANRRRLHGLRLLDIGDFVIHREMCSLCSYRICED